MSFPTCVIPTINPVYHVHQEEIFQSISDDNSAVIRGDIVKLQQTSVSPVTHQPLILNIVNHLGNDPPRHVLQHRHHRFIFLSGSHPVQILAELRLW
jgi:hypothetical protein